MDEHKLKLSKVGFGLALGITWGLAILLTGLIASRSGWGNAFVDVMGSVYIGFDATPVGSVIGGLFGFLDAFIAGFVIAWLYNVFSCCCRRK